MSAAVSLCPGPDSSRNVALCAEPECTSRKLAKSLAKQSTEEIQQIKVPNLFFSPIKEKKVSRGEGGERRHVIIFSCDLSWAPG